MVLVEGIPHSLHPIVLPLMAGPGAMTKGSVCIPQVMLVLPVSMLYISKQSSPTARDTLSPFGKPNFNCGSIPYGLIVQEQKAFIGSPLLPTPFKQNEWVF